MKNLTYLSSILAVTSVTVLGLSTPASASTFFTIGDRIGGSSSVDGLVTLGSTGTTTDPFARFYAGSTSTVSGDTLISFDFAGSPETTPFDVAPVGSSADTFNGGIADGGFAEFAGVTSSFQSFAFGPPTTIIKNFYVSEVGNERFEFDLDVSTLSNGTGVNYDISLGTGTNFDATFSNVRIRRFSNGELTDQAIGVWQFTSQNLLSDPIVPNTGDNDGGNAVGIVPAQTYSWSLEVVADVPIPESSNVVGLLALGIIGGGAILARQVRR
ncbi:MAG: hypothetical protein AB4041_16625 [Microcystaceae cyanobacterium]